METLIVSTVITFLLYGGLLVAARFKRTDSDEIQRREHVRNMDRERSGESSEGAEEESSESKSAFKRFLKEVSKG